jgi:hypothetical protein
MNRHRKQEAVEGLGRLPEGRPGKEAVNNLYMERNKMNVRHIIVAVSAAAILAGSSFGALAGGYHKKAYSKGESESSVISVGVVHYGTPFAITLQHQENSSFTNQHNGSAGAGAGTDGGALAGSLGGGGSPLTQILHIGGPSVSVAASWGSTDGSSCAGSACD